MGKLIEMPAPFRICRILIHGDRDCSFVSILVEPHSRGLALIRRNVSGILEAMNCVECLGLARDLAGEVIRSIVAGKIFLVEDAAISDSAYESFKNVAL